MDKNYWSQFESITDAQGFDKSPKFKMTNAGDITRIAFPLVNPQTKQVALKKVVFFSYSDNLASKWCRFIAPADKSSKAYIEAIKNCGEPLVNYVTPVLVYTTNDKGRIISPDEYVLTNLTLAPKRLRSLQQVQADYDLSSCDVKVVCDEVKYQALSFHALQGCAYRDGVVKQKDKMGKLADMRMSIDADKVFNDAIALSNDSETAVASRWTDDQILSYFNVKTDLEFDDEPNNNADDSLPDWD